MLFRSTSRRSSVATIDAFLSSGNRVATAGEVEALATSLNGVRLVLGTLLDVRDDDAPEPDTPDHALYQYLSWIVDSAVSALLSA